MENPFTLAFGIQPQSLIDRKTILEPLIRSFTQSNPSSYVYMISGVRGSGKTVLLSETADTFEQKENWIVCNLNPERDLIRQLLAKLVRVPSVTSLLQKSKLTVSIPGISLEMSGSSVITDPAVALEEVLFRLRDKGISVLVTIDEVTPSQNIKSFVSEFQILIRERCRVFLVMTGLYDNIQNLQNSPTLTFLYRSPRIETTPLNQNLMAQAYQSVFNLSVADAICMANCTKGYPFAYQALGFYTFENHCSWQDALPLLDACLEDMVYSKIWSELPKSQKRILQAMAEDETGNVTQIRQNVGMKPEKFSVYRSRLLKKQIVKAPAHGMLRFSLPRFQEFVERQSLTEVL